MRLTDQQTAVLTLLSMETGYRPYQEVAKKGGIKPGSFLAQLAKLREGELVEKETGESKGSNWVITDLGKKTLQKVQDTAPEVLAKEAAAAKAEKAKAAAEAKALTEEKVEERVEEKVEEKVEEVGKPIEERGAELSREQAGYTDYQIFLNMGKTWGGIPTEKLKAISTIVFAHDPYDLDVVWQQLSEINLAIDIRKGWFKDWQAHLKGAGKPVTISDRVQAEITPPSKRTEEQRKEMAEEGRDCDLVLGENGFWEVKRIGGGLGEYIFAEANKEEVTRNAVLRQTSGQQQFPQEPASQILTALAPYLKPESGAKSPSQIS